MDGLAPADRDAVLMEVSAHHDVQGVPPLKGAAGSDAISEAGEGGAARGAVALRQIDLVIGAPDRMKPTRATRLAIDLRRATLYGVPEDRATTRCC